MLNPDDTKEVRTQVARAILEKKQLASSASGTKGKSKCAAAPSAPRILELQGGAIVDVAWMRKYLPITTGCTCTKDLTFHMRFIGKYPTPVAPHMLSSVWNDEKTQWEAALTCVRWCWKEHEKRTFEKCPYDFV